MERERKPDTREIVDVIKAYHELHSDFEEVVQSTCDFFNAHGEGTAQNYIELARFIKHRAKNNPVFDYEFQAA